jgi:adenylate cyclase
VLELLATGEQEGERSRIGVREGDEVVVGRDSGCQWVIVWDPHLSRRHFTLKARKETLIVEVVSERVNPIFYRGQEARSFEVKPGEAFVVGTTTFHLLANRTDFASPSQPDVQEFTFTREQLDLVSFSDAEKRIEILTHLPDLIINSRNDDEVFARVTAILLTGMIQVEAVAIVGIVDGKVAVFYTSRKYEAAGEVYPSKKLVQEAVSHQDQTVLHVWGIGDQQTGPQYTMASEADWALCTPLSGSQQKFGIYCSGKMPDHRSFEGSPMMTPVNRMNADIKFVELVSEIVGSILRLRNLERQQAGLRQFFSPPILQALGDQFDTKILEPRECDVVAMFCDLRDFSKRAEQKSGDLFGILHQVSLALEIVTREILRHGGVIGDFHGDAALGFWGWPLTNKDVGLQACRAALAIRQSFEALRNYPDPQIASTKMGIGLAYGRAVAGKIGTSDQVKVTVFGPVVNLASRLESCTRTLRVPVVLEESLVRLVRDRLSSEEGRLRKLARIIPYGLQTPHDVYELLPAHGPNCTLTDEQVATYETGINQFIDGKWDEAYRHLHSMPSTDQAMDFIIARIAEHNRVAPSNWDGIVRLTSK